MSCYFRIYATKLLIDNQFLIFLLNNMNFSSPLFLSVNLRLLIIFYIHLFSFSVTIVVDLFVHKISLYFFTFCFEIYRFRTSHYHNIWNYILSVKLILKFNGIFACILQLTPFHFHGPLVSSIVGIIIKTVRSLNLASI